MVEDRIWTTEIVLIEIYWIPFARCSLCSLKVLLCLVGFRKDHDAKKLDSKRKSGAKKRKANVDGHVNGDLEDGAAGADDDNDDDDEDTM